jgi:hypothetical protein
MTIRPMVELGLDASVLLSKADAVFDANHYASTNNLIGFNIDSLTELENQNWPELLTALFVLDFSNILLDNRYPTEFGLVEAFEALAKGHGILPPPGNNSDAIDNGTEQSFYVVTHICYVLNAFSTISSRGLRIPWVDQYIDECARYGAINRL